MKRANRAYVINMFIGLVFWLIFFPGLFSTDSFAAYEMAKSGELSNAWTASWAVYVQQFSFHGRYISIVTLCNLLLLIYSVTRLSEVIFERKIAKIASLTVCTMPVVSGMGITLWHDIPMTAGLILISSSLITLVKSEYKIIRRTLIELVIGSVFITFRPNGIPTVVLTLLLLLAWRAVRRSASVLILAVVVALVFSSIMSFGIVREPLISRYFAQEWMRNDISCFASKVDAKKFAAVTNIEESKYGQWISEDACTFLNRAKLTEKERIESLDYIPTSWIYLFIKEPGFVFSTHLKRNSYLLPIPLHGVPTPPFMHTNIEFENRGIEWVFENQANIFRNYFRLWNFFRGITAWAGLWFAILLAISFQSQRTEFKLLSLIGFSLIGILFIFAPIPDGRYALYVLLIAQLTLIGTITSWISRKHVSV